MLLFATLALGLMYGCSENEVTIDSGNETGQDINAYVSVRINLPTGSANTRAYKEGFDDGNADEYAVKDLTLLFFKIPEGATSENDYVIENIASTLEEINTVEGNFSLPSFSSSGTTTDDITSSASTSAISVSANVKAVAALINIKDERSIAKSNLTIGNTFGAINNALELNIKNVTDVANGFMMTSSPLLNSDNSAAFTLAACTPQISEELALKNENKVNVKVERIVSKVELLESVTSESTTVADEAALMSATRGAWYKLGTADSYKMAYLIGGTDGHAGDAIVIKGWTLDVTNKYAYPFRNVDVATWSAGNSTVWGLIKDNSRMYFAKDPNYDGTFVKNVTEDFNLIQATDIFSDKLSANTVGDATPTGTRNPQYCLENTFNTDNQKENQTTRLVIKAKYIPNSNASADADGTWYSLNGRTTHYSTINLKEEIRLIGVNAGIFNASDEVSMTFTTTNQTTKVGTLTVNSNNEDPARLNDLLIIKCYDQGICYYPIRIRHFSDIEVHGGAWSYPGSYTSLNLGRYGVVRNTSYRVKINTISQPGEPDVPPTPNEDDDDQNLYLSCTIDILAWALRPVQDADL